jgi:hypothetical protein
MANAGILSAVLVEAEAAPGMDDIGRPSSADGPFAVEFGGSHQTSEE